jgi:soluble lytic murein transglycosylase-like protein
MKKLLLLLSLLLFSALAVQAQTVQAEGKSELRYRFDNFDTRDGVRIELPPSKIATKRSSRKRLTSRSVDSLPISSDAPQVTTALSMAVRKSLDGFSTGDPNVDAFIVDSGSRNGVDPVLLYAIMHQESSFKKRAVSHAGARGLMQLMPGTAARFGVRNIFDPRQNIEGGTRYMRFLLDLFDGDVGLALAGYNAGEGAVLRYGRSVPPYAETRDYVRRISRRYELMRDPQTARRALAATDAQLATIRAAEKVAPPLYEQQVFAVRTPDGKLQLVSQ